MIRILTARAVKKPRRHHYCDVCWRILAGPHIYLSGIADGTGFTVTRVHARCCEPRGVARVGTAIAKVEAMEVPA